MRELAASEAQIAGLAANGALCGGVALSQVLRWAATSATEATP